MKNRNLFIDAATVLSSLLLVTGFICYRAGMFNRLLAESPPPATATASETNPDGGGPVKDVAVTVQENKTGSLLFMVGSKSAAVFQPTATPPGTVPPAPSQEPTLPTPQPNVTVIMSGSKSVFIPATPTFPVGNQPNPPSTPVARPAASPPPAPVTAPPVLLPGSKSVGIQFQPPALTPPTAPVQQAAHPQKP